MGNMYEIRLKGHLDQRNQEWLAGFSMTLRPEGETILTGRITDQAALYGLLIRLRDLGIPLLAVNHLGPAPSEKEVVRRWKRWKANR